MTRKRYFEWIDGDDKGTVVSLETISEIDGELFYNFDDGESCNQRFISKITSNVVDLKGKFMVEVENPHNIWSFEVIDTVMPQGIGCDGNEQIPTLHDFINSTAGGGASTAEVKESDLGKEKLVPPKKPQQTRPLPKMEDYKEVPVKKEEKRPVVSVVDTPKEVSEQNVPVAVCDTDIVSETTPVEKITETEHCEHKATQLSDPVAILVENCKKHATEIPLTLTIMLPMRSLYRIARSEFDDGGEKFINYIVDRIDTDGIISELKTALREAYNSGMEDSEE